ncbi:uncharacterized protein LOC143226861 isoform X2 [Tachypleus tridentatus]|uniref:uncharacterized protein LOC143226861 isoform X2 n=1 Tax=Tachypleus tridentatus TaxID=6853 RepID=UPI003FD1FE30
MDLLQKTSPNILKHTQKSISNTQTSYNTYTSLEEFKGFCRLARIFRVFGGFPLVIPKTEGRFKRSVIATVHTVFVSVCLVASCIFNLAKLYINPDASFHRISSTILYSFVTATCVVAIYSMQRNAPRFDDYFSCYQRMKEKLPPMSSELQRIRIQRVSRTLELIFLFIVLESVGFTFISETKDYWKTKFGSENLDNTLITSTRLSRVFWSFWSSVCRVPFFFCIYLSVTLTEDLKSFNYYLDNFLTAKDNHRHSEELEKLRLLYNRLCDVVDKTSQLFSPAIFIYTATMLCVSCLLLTFAVRSNTIIFAMVSFIFIVELNITCCYTEGIDLENSKLLDIISKAKVRNSSKEFINQLDFLLSRHVNSSKVILNASRTFDLNKNLVSSELQICSP